MEALIHKFQIFRIIVGAYRSDVKHDAKAGPTLPHNGFRAGAGAGIHPVNLKES
ncbi:hypothetical protein GIY62_17675 [Burkholderia plantarii]|uniref:hypothetical protein n=1 Tax=Burkholderia plantarii TaxID=41899 RepID=UPI0027296136|nr:hypothetical protein [Burkholderia plantarii]WLE58909.1 hypothetical protein GIY62_17675 [Burkholderia plantarii]